MIILEYSTTKIGKQREQEKRYLALLWNKFSLPGIIALVLLERKNWFSLLHLLFLLPNEIHLELPNIVSFLSATASIINLSVYLKLMLPTNFICSSIQSMLEQMLNAVQFLALNLSLPLLSFVRLHRTRISTHC